MKNGKRMKFNGVARIVILAIVISAIMGITAVEAAAYGIRDCSDCPDSGLAFSEPKSWERKNDFSCFYYSPIADGYSGRIHVRK